MASTLLVLPGVVVRPVTGTVTCCGGLGGCGLCGPCKYRASRIGPMAPWLCPMVIPDAGSGRSAAEQRREMRDAGGVQGVLRIRRNVFRLRGTELERPFDVGRLQLAGTRAGEV